MHRFALAALVVLGLGSVDSASAAGRQQSGPEAVVVRYGDLDLASERGVAALDRRLGSAIQAYCRGLAPFLPHQAQARRACRAEAWQAVAAQRSAAIAAVRSGATQISAREP